MEHPAPATEIAKTTVLETQIAPTRSPVRITKVWRDVITHPTGASGEVAIVHVYYNWTDGAQTVRPNVIGGAWLCVHPGSGWPDALEACDHIAILEDVLS